MVREHLSCSLIPVCSESALVSVEIEVSAAVDPSPAKATIRRTKSASSSTRRPALDNGMLDTPKPVKFAMTVARVP